jgi:hypothetical protein
MPGLEGEPPVWLLGLSGLLAQFQATLGTGFSAVYYHCKGYMDFGQSFMISCLQLAAACAWPA